MKLEYHEFKASLAHASKQVESLHPNKHYVLRMADLGEDGSSWGFRIERPYEELCKEMGVISFEGHHTDPYIVESHELDTDKNDSIADIYVDVEGLDNALLIAQNFIENSEKISNVSLFFARNYSDLGQKLWQLDYRGENINSNTLHIRVKVDVEKGIIANVEIKA